MKPNELMIGDLVIYGGLYTKAICIGQKISLYDGKGTEFTIDPCHVEPIPLTQEILEKNGFKKVNMTVDGDYRHYHLHGVCISWEEQSGFWYGDGDIEFKYVHELQHLLRLCDTKIEIEL